jgi:DNA-binding transcriptional MocR family regulator
MIEPLYQSLAGRIAGLIHAGTFPAGSRLPSVRRLAREQGVSLTTVIEAYGRLEDKRVIESRPRSGYFVRVPEVVAGQLPRKARRRSQPVAVRCSAIFDAMMEAVADPKVVPFGMAVPGDDMIPGRRLSSITNAVIRRYGTAAFRYTLTPGRSELRAALSRRMLGAGIDAGPDQVVTTQGATEALALAIKASTRPGDLVAVEAPTFFGILHLLKGHGLKVIEVPVDARNGMDLDELEFILVRHRIKACVVQPSFQNPVGSCMSDDAKMRLVSLAQRYDFTLIEDDLYAELCFQGHRPKALAHFDAAGRVIHCGAVSKILSPGLRVGWVSSIKHLDAIKAAKAAHYPANPTISELVVAEFMEAGGYDRHLRRIRTIYRERCSRMREAVLSAFPGETRVNQPQGGFVLWMEMHEAFDSEQFAVDALEKGISLMPGSVFSPTCRLKHCLRLSCGGAFNRGAEKAIETLGVLAASYH